jgi:hypothetical protein
MFYASALGLPQRLQYADGVCFPMLSPVENKNLRGYPDKELMLLEILSKVLDNTIPVARNVSMIMWSPPEPWALTREESIRSGIKAWYIGESCWINLERPFNSIKKEEAEWVAYRTIIQGVDDIRRLNLWGQWLEIASLRKLFMRVFQMRQDYVASLVPQQYFQDLIKLEVELFSVYRLDTEASSNV